MSQAVANPPSSPSPAPSTSRIKNYFAVGEEVRIPGWVIDFDSFRKWTLSDEFPECGRIDYLDDEIWADMTMEELFIHNQVKARIALVLGPLIDTSNLGILILDRMRLVNRSAGLSCEPDMAFATWESMKSGKLRSNPGQTGQDLELDGTPDMVLEIISDSSVKKDTVNLMQRYAAAGIPEYWLIDVRKPAIRFEILRLHPSGYQAQASADGWAKSIVFNNEFRLVRGMNPLGKPQFTLEVR